MVKFKVKPSQKENWRYIAFKVIGEQSFAEKDIVKAITSSVLRFLGEVGASKTNIWLLSFDEQKQLGMLRCSHKAQRDVIASITTVTKISEHRAILNVLGVSGTIKKAKEKYFKIIY